MDSHALDIIAHRSPPVDQQNSASTVETDQPEDPAVGTKRARMMPDSKKVLPSSDVYEYTETALRLSILHNYYEPYTLKLLIRLHAQNFFLLRCR